MSRTTNQINNGVTRLAYLGGTVLFASSILGTFIEPFIPLAVTIIGSLIVGFLVRAIFVRMLNKKLFSSYRYTATNTNTNRQSTQSRTNNTRDNTTTNEKITHDTFTSTDSLSLYLNLLGLGPRFTANELKAAYRSKAAMFHPDCYASSSPSEQKNAEELMKKVNEAYERLKPAAV